MIKQTMNVLFDPQTVLQLLHQMLLWLMLSNVLISLMQVVDAQFCPGYNVHFHFGHRASILVIFFLVIYRVFESFCISYLLRVYFVFKYYLSLNAIFVFVSYHVVFFVFITSNVVLFNYMLQLIVFLINHIILIIFL